MPEKTKTLVINTGPIIALVAALGNLSILKELYKKVIVPYEVSREIQAGGPKGFAVKEFRDTDCLEKRTKPITIFPFLLNSLDIGEASVIQLAINENIDTVCIDEEAGRRMARLNNLKVTGSIGILIRAKNDGIPFSMKEALENMKKQGIWLSNTVIDFALNSSN